MKSLFAFVLLFGLSVCAICCSQDQLDRTARDAQIVKNTTTQPSVQVIAAATDPLTGGIGSVVLGVTGLAASLVLNIAQNLSHASTKKNLAVAQTMLAAGVQATTPIVTTPVSVTAVEPVVLKK